MKWKHLAYSKTKIIKFQAPACKVVMLLFWDCNAPTIENCLEQDTIVAAASYTEILKRRLKMTFSKKRSGFISKGFFGPQ